ncbi:hypothetical protein CYMTET_16861 [Cymbomonas tetramitiformis]|uniref:Uncharacterized protein n=1 Tax=Cymbomonas tetramitiformis TaxID=36881 RepID=A0AAE0GBC3_9CHLO|nr:hypothetical protein CYMTET_16861 [Cymbomonas tetramitiformis]
MTEIVLSDISEVEEETSDILFHSIGEFCVNPSRDLQGSRIAAYAKRLDTCSKYGVTAFADAKGVYVGMTTEILSAAAELKLAAQVPGSAEVAPPQEGLDLDGVYEETSLARDPLLPASTVTTVRLEGVSIVSFSGDGILLAACTGGTLQVYEVYDLVQGRTEAAARWDLTEGGSGEIKSVSWNPKKGVLVAVTTGGKLHHVSYSGAGRLMVCCDVHGSEEREVGAATFSPDGTLLCYSWGDRVVVAGGSAPFVERWSMRLPEELSAHTIGWVEAGSLLLGCSYEDPEDSFDDRHKLLRVHHFEGSLETGCALEVIDYMDGLLGADDKEYELMRGKGASLGFAAAVTGWGLAVTAQRMSAALAVVRYSGTPASLVPEEEGQGAVLPMTADGDECYVVGLAVDTSSLGVTVTHPGDAAPLPSSPVLLVALSDGRVTMFSFGRTDRSAYTGTLVAAPIPLPPVSVVPPSPSPGELPSAMPVPPPATSAATGAAFGSTTFPVAATGAAFGSTTFPVAATGAAFGSTTVPVAATGGAFGSNS